MFNVQLSFCYDRKYPYGAALRHLREFSRAAPVQNILHSDGIDSPSGLHRNVLLAINRERRGLARDAGVGRELPKELSSLGIKCMEVPIVRAAAEHQPASGCEHWSPVHRIGIHVRPHFLSRVDI